MMQVCYSVGVVRGRRLFFLMIRRQPRSSPLPYAALFRSVHLGHRVTRLTRLEDNSFELHTEGNICFQTRAVVIAAGLGAFKPRPLRLDGIDQFEQTNLHYHVADKNHFKDKRVVILGGGDSALDWVLELAVVAKHVHIVHRRDEFRAAPASIAKMQELIDDPNQPVDCLIGRIPSYQSDQGKIGRASCRERV